MRALATFVGGMSASCDAKRLSFCDDAVRRLMSKGCVEQCRKTRLQRAESDECSHGGGSVRCSRVLPDGCVEAILNCRGEACQGGVEDVYHQVSHSEDEIEIAQPQPV